MMSDRWVWSSRQIRSKASLLAPRQKRRRSVLRVDPLTPTTEAELQAKALGHALSHAHFFVSYGSTLRGVFVPTLSHTFR